VITFRNSSYRHRIALLACAAAAWTASAHPADTFRPSVKFCNRTLPTAYVAISYDLAPSSNSTSVGWYAVNGCTCRTVLQNKQLKATEIFLLANRGNGKLNLLQPAKGGMCTKDVAFNLTDGNANARACTAAGGRWMNSRWYDTVGKPLTVNLRIPGQCNLMGDN
jgi:uncharacterized membrane protein